VGQLSRETNGASVHKTPNVRLTSLGRFSPNRPDLTFVSVREIRLIHNCDSISELTLLIRSAYKALADMGLNYTGSYQDEVITLDRIKGNECFVMLDGGALVGTITLYRYCEYHERFSHSDVAMCGQFAVKPELQRQGLGSQLMDVVERRAAEVGARELALTLLRTPSTWFAFT
jgi:GNAT superfamily N-acetyltransferase